jgi:hypothetical protein
MTAKLSRSYPRIANWNNQVTFGKPQSAELPTVSVNFSDFQFRIFLTCLALSNILLCFWPCIGFHSVVNGTSQRQVPQCRNEMKAEAGPELFYSSNLWRSLPVNSPSFIVLAEILEDWVSVDQPMFYAPWADTRGQREIQTPSVKHTEFVKLRLT